MCFVDCFSNAVIRRINPTFKCGVAVISNAAVWGVFVFHPIITCVAVPCSFLFGLSQT